MMGSLDEDIKTLFVWTLRLVMRVFSDLKTTKKHSVSTFGSLG